MADTQLAQGANGDVAGDSPANGAAQVNIWASLSLVSIKNISNIPILIRKMFE